MSEAEGMEQGQQGSEQHVREKTMSEAKKRRMRQQNILQAMVSFALMIAFTMLAFYAVISPEVPGTFASFFILLLATVQVILQLFIFMHLKERGSAYPIFFIATGVIFAVAILIFIIHVRSL